MKSRLQPIPVTKILPAPPRLILMNQTPPLVPHPLQKRTVPERTTPRKRFRLKPPILLKLPLSLSQSLPRLSDRPYRDDPISSADELIQIPINKRIIMNPIQATILPQRNILRRKGKLVTKLPAAIPTPRALKSQRNSELR